MRRATVESAYQGAWRVLWFFAGYDHQYSTRQARV